MIFSFNNCFKNGILPIVFNDKVVENLFDQVEDQSGFTIRVDLQNQNIELPDGEILEFEVDSFRKHALLNGLDDIGLTLQKADVIRDYEARRANEAPWLFS